MRPFIGSEIWVQPWHSKESIYEQVFQLKKYGMECARIFLDWRHVEEKAGEFNFSLYDTVFAAAEEAGVKLQITLMHLNWLPRWRQREIGCQANAYDAEPENCSLRDRYVREVVRRYKNSPALDVWILANEPRWKLSLTEPNLKRFREYIRERHKNPMELYKLYGVFQVDEIGYIKPDGSVDLGMDAQWEFAGEIDWAGMETETLMELLQQTKNLIREEDQTHAITVNPDDISKASLIEGGRDLWRFGRIADFLGMSCHVAWHSTRFAEEKIHQSIGMFCDLTRSATMNDDKYFQVTELQAGTNYFSGVRPTCPSPKELTRWILDLVGGGAGGIVYWLLNPRDHGFEGLEWGLNNQLGQASKRTLASEGVSKILKETEAFGHAKPLLPEIYLLHDVDSITLAILEARIAGSGTEKQDPRNPYLAADALCGAYCMLWDLGYRVGFVNGEKISSLPKDAVLIAPNIYAPAESTLMNIADFVERGGRLIADGLFAVKNPYGNRVDERKEVMESLFGGQMEDFEVCTDPFFLSDESCAVPGFYLKGSFGETQERTVLARWEDESAAAIQKGNCIYIGTQFFQGYFATEGCEASLSFIKNILPKHSGICLQNPGTQLRLRAMNHMLILTNSGEKATAKLLFPEKHMKYCTLDGKIVADQVEVEENGYAILLPA